MDDLSFVFSYSSPKSSHSQVSLGGTIKIQLENFLRRRIPVHWNSNSHDGFVGGGRDYWRVEIKGIQDTPLTWRGGEVRVRPSFGVNGFLEILCNWVPKNLSGGIGVLEYSIIALFLSVPEHKAQGKHLELIEDVTFKGRIHPVLERLGYVAFFSVGVSEGLYNIVP